MTVDPTSAGSIRATLKRGGGTQQACDRLTALLGGTGIRGQAGKIEQLCSQLSQAADPIEQWSRILTELEQLTVNKNVSDAAVPAPATPATPTLSGAGFTKQDLEKIGQKLSLEDWLELSLVELQDVPTFEYRQKEAEYIRFADASAGQQATALLGVLLNQKGPPLIIDQPEEDLDNQVILEVVKELWKAKGNRQIIVSSHNANIVVNGDADLVICCGYRTAGDQSGGKVKCQGAIDVAEIRKEITTVMEGGRDAFRLRKEKYGF